MNKIKTHIIENKIDYLGYLIAALMLIQISSVDGYIFVGIGGLVFGGMFALILAPVVYVTIFIEGLREFKTTEDLLDLLYAILGISGLVVSVIFVLYQTGGLYI